MPLIIYRPDVYQGYSKYSPISQPQSNSKDSGTVTSENPEYATYLKKKDAYELALKLYNNAHKGKNPYINQQSQIVQRYYKMIELGQESLAYAEQNSLKNTPQFLTKDKDSLGQGISIMPKENKLNQVIAPPTTSLTPYINEYVNQPKVKDNNINQKFNDAINNGDILGYSGKLLTPQQSAKQNLLYDAKLISDKELTPEYGNYYTGTTVKGQEILNYISPKTLQPHAYEQAEPSKLEPTLMGAGGTASGIMDVPPEIKQSVLNKATSINTYLEKNLPLYKNIEEGYKIDRYYFFAPIKEFKNSVSKFSDKLSSSKFNDVLVGNIAGVETFRLSDVLKVGSDLVPTNELQIGEYYLGGKAFKMFPLVTGSIFGTSGVIQRASAKSDIERINADLQIVMGGAGIFESSLIPKVRTLDIPLKKSRNILDIAIEKQPSSLSFTKDLEIELYEKVRPSDIIKSKKDTLYLEKTPSEFGELKKGRGSDILGGFKDKPFSGNPEIENLIVVKKGEGITLQRTEAKALHELTHLETKDIFKEQLEKTLPYNQRPSELVAIEMEKLVDKEGFIDLNKLDIINEAQKRQPSSFSFGKDIELEIKTKSDIKIKEELKTPTENINKEEVKLFGFETKKGKSLILFSKTSKGIKLGTPDIIEYLKDLDNSKEIKIGSALETKALEKNLLNIDSTQRAKDLIPIARDLLSKSLKTNSRFIDKSELTSATQRLSKEGVNVVLDIAKENEGILFGSKARAVQLAKEYKIGNENFILNKVPRDIELRFDKISEEGLQGITDKLVERLKDLGIKEEGNLKIDYSSTREIKDTPFAIESKVNGKYEKIVELKGKGSEIEGEEVPEYVVGIKKPGKTIDIEGVRTTKLNEELRGVTQGVLRVRINEEGILDIYPSPKRLKDIGSVSVSARTLQMSKIIGKKRYLKNIESFESLFPEDLVREQVKKVLSEPEKVKLADFSKEKDLNKISLNYLNRVSGIDDNYLKSYNLKSDSLLSKSFSPSLSVSPSPSKSISPYTSLSTSPSPSKSVSPSKSFSPSPSKSISPYTSLSTSPSPSKSVSPSKSFSPSLSVSPSPSKSISPYSFDEPYEFNKLKSNKEQKKRPGIRKVNIYAVEIRKNRKFKTVGTNFTLGQATRFRQNILLKDIARTGRIKQIGTREELGFDEEALTDRNLFRDYKIKNGKTIFTPNQVIQRTSANLKSREEQYQIQSAKRLKNLIYPKI